MYKGGDELKVKLQQLREGMGYYDSKSGGSPLDKSMNSQNNSVLLPELKGGVGPSINKQQSLQGG